MATTTQPEDQMVTTTTQALRNVRVSDRLRRTPFGNSFIDVVADVRDGDEDDARWVPDDVLTVRADILGEDVARAVAAAAALAIAAAGGAPAGG